MPKENWQAGVSADGRGIVLWVPEIEYQGNLFDEGKPVAFYAGGFPSGIYAGRTAAGTRIIPLVDPLLTLLRAHRERAGENAYGLVFVDSQGAPIDPDTETDTWMRAAQTVTPNRVRLHDLRHTTVDLLLEAGVPEDVVMEIVGHADRAVTRGYKSTSKLARRTDGMRALSASLGFDQT